MTTVGVLALQGAFAEHQTMLAKVGAKSFQIRSAQDLERPLDGIIIPGGESTVIGKLLDELHMDVPLRRQIAAGLPVFGTCAGLILLAAQIDGRSNTVLGTMPIEASRNAYGRQLGSFCTTAPFGDIGVIPMEFIRAPYIVSCGAGVSALATVDGRIVAAQYGNQLATAFHPELTDSTAIHRYFIDQIVKKRCTCPN